VQLAPYQYSVIIGLLLSDGWLGFSSKANKNARLEFKKSLAHYQYVWFVFNILSHYCSSSLRLKTGIRAGNRFYGLQFCTRSMPCLTENRLKIYISAKSMNSLSLIVKPHMIKSMYYKIKH